MNFTKFYDQEQKWAKDWTLRDTIFYWSLIGYMTITWNIVLYRKDKS